MDGQLLQALYRELFLNRKPHYPRRCRYSDNLVAFLYCFGVQRNLSMSAALERRRWPLWLRRLPRISYSEFMRRAVTPSVAALVAELNRGWRAQLPCTGHKSVDGKPLTVGVYSKDPEARRGFLAPCYWGRGYKLHAIVDAGGAIDAFCVTSLNVGEAPVARQQLLAQLDGRGVVLRGDANYDSNELYAAVADAGGRFVAPRRKPGTGVSAGHTQHPDRRRAIRELEHGPGALYVHRRHRVRIEQTFGQLTNLPGGLASLPNSVRRLPRVQRWVAAKIALYHLYRTHRTRPHQIA